MKRLILSLGILLILSVNIWAQNEPAPPPDNDFYKFFYSGGPLVWLVLLPLSLVTVSLATQSLLAIRGKKLLPLTVQEKAKQMIQDGQYDHLAEFLSRNGSMLARLLRIALIERPAGRIAMENGVSDYLEQDTTEMLRRIEWLNIIGNVGPMIGLFGTVWGMIDTFSAIVRAGGQPEAPALADGISTALVTTWWGMVVAIPALAVYGFLRNRIDSLAARAAVHAEEVIQLITEHQVESQA